MVRLFHHAHLPLYNLFTFAGKGNGTIATSPVHDVEDPNACTAAKSLEETYRIVPPGEFLNNSNHPPNDDSYPCCGVWAKAQKETNMTIVKQWQRK